MEEPTLELSSDHTARAPQPPPAPVDYLASIVEFTQTLPGSTIGRYVVLETIGKGGMGTVLRAYDPKLRREVALKRLRSLKPDEDSEARLVREAQALAQLTHPNVVAVYDVNAEPEGVVVTMELVHGSTLWHWLKTPHSWQECVDVMLQAGRGLVAAHHANLVHRDFKPANVMLTPEGVAKVMDFGLAKPTNTEERSSPDSIEPLAYADWSRSSGHGLDSSPEIVTAAHLVLGTPAYMAPEQHRGSVAGPAVDQYAFCVTLWEALHGWRPFDGPLKEMVIAKVNGPPAWPRGVDVPRRLVHAIQRGLSARPEARWPTMQDLLDELNAVVRPRRSRAAVALGGAVLVGTIGSVSWLQLRTPSGCPDPRERLVGVWDEPTRAAIGTHIEALPVDDATLVWTQLSQRLNGYADSWVEGHREACEATTIRAEQSTAILDLRMACLYRARAEWDATMRRLGELDERTLPRALGLVERLPRLVRCTDVDVLLAQLPPPDDPELRAAVERAEQHLAEAITLHRLARYDAANEAIAQIESDLRGFEYPPVTAKKLWLEGALLEAKGRYAAAEQRLRQAMDLAIVQGTFETAARVSFQWSFVLGQRLQRRDEAQLVAELGLSLARRAPDPFYTLEGRALAQIANTKKVNSEWDEADVFYRQAIEQLEQGGASAEIDLAVTLHDHANLLAQRGLLDEASAIHHRVLEIRARLFGSDHPYLGSSMYSLGNIAYQLDELDRAQQMYERALEIFSRSYGPDHPTTTTAARTNLGRLALEQGELEQAAQIFEDVAYARVRQLGPAHPEVATAYADLGKVDHERGALESARQLYEQALEIWQASLEPNDNRLHSAHHNLGVVNKDLGHIEQALRHFELALTVSAELRPDQQGHTQFEMATLLWEQPNTRARALAIARDALASYHKAESANEERREVEAWLHEHPSESG
ncbi:MAG: tetratricopeptide repeat protein [Myxococcota bacterium]